MTSRLPAPCEAARCLIWLAFVVLAPVSCASRQHASIAAKAPVPPTMQRQVLNAVSLDDGDYPTDVLRNRVVGEPGNLPARLALAERYVRIGAPELAIDHYQLAAERFPENQGLAMLLARNLRDFGHRPEAIAALVNFCKRNLQAAPELLSLLGILRDDAGQFAAAEADYRIAIAQAPSRADLHNNLGYNLLLQGKSGQAVDEFEAALKIEPHSEFAHNNLALALLAQWKDDSQPREALLHWQSVSDPASAHNNLATVLIEQKRYAEARKELEIALSYRKDHAEALSNLKLVADIDHGPDRPPPQARSSFWKRVKTVFTTSKSSTAVETASK